jgi:predicted 3-demethylubiquinone-9 3-methyltransferase (glyoxalase superfamily)
MNASEAAHFYCNTFNDAEITDENPAVVRFKVAGQSFMCLNGGPMFQPNPSISFYTVCETEEEINALWTRFSEGGMVMMPLNKYPWSERYGWVQDKFGFSWQLTLGKIEEVGQKFTPLLMFSGPMAGRSSDALDLYASVFNPAHVIIKVPYTEDDEGITGTLKHGRVKLGNSILMAMDSHAPHNLSFNEAISLVVECEDQAEIDYYWSKLTEGGQESMCGWLKDPFGVSWQIVPRILGQLMSDPSRSKRVAEAFMKMKKFEIDKLMMA